VDLRYIHIFLIAAAPLTELRGAIPYGIFYDLPVEKVFLTAVAGNIVPVFPLLLFLDFLKELALKFRYTGNLAQRVLQRIEKKKDIVENYGYAGLILFVAIPFPVTGAYTGSIIASMLGLHRLRAFLSICAGVLISGIIVTLVSTGAFRLVSL